MSDKILAQEYKIEMGNVEVWSKTSHLHFVQKFM